MTLLLLLTSPLYATGLADAFNSLISFTKPGIYHAQARGYMTAGEVNVHFPGENVQLVSLSPPSYSSGCNGISLFMGGFSYISGQQFTSLLKAIATSALGYAFQLALRTLCPICATVVSDLQKAAQFANQFALNQCQLAEGIINLGIKSKAVLEHWISSLGASVSSAGGEASDYLAAMHGLTGDVGEALNKVKRKVESIKEKGARQEAAQSTSLGNSTWQMLAGLSDNQKVFIQSLVGSTLLTTIVSDDGTKKPTIMRLPPTLTTESLAKVFLYGTNARENSHIYLWQCDVKNDDLISNAGICSQAHKVTLLESDWHKVGSQVQGISLSDYGFFGVTYALLFQALKNLENKHALGTPEKIQLPIDIYDSNHAPLVVESAFTENQIIAFISMAPVPLYRALNISALYPDIAESLINNITNVVASHYTVAYLQQLLDIKHSDNSLGGTSGISPQDFVQLESTLRNISAGVNQQLNDFLTNLQVNEAWLAQINQIQSLIYSQILSSGLVNNFAYNTALMNGNI